jgi:hypothetical protein
VKHLRLITIPRPAFSRSRKKKEENVAFDNYKNFVWVAFSAGFDAAATSATLVSGDVARLPSVPFDLTCWNLTDFGTPSLDPFREILRVTAAPVGDVITFARAQQGTTATAKNISGKSYVAIAGINEKFFTDLAAALAAGGGVAPELVSAEIGFVDTSTVSVTFDQTVKSVDFTEGVTIKVNGTPRSITSATRQTDKTKVYFVLSSAVGLVDTILLSYARIDGFITNAAGDSLDDIVDAAVTNNAGAARIFDEFTDSDGTSLPSHVIAPTNIPATSWTNDHGTWSIQGNKATTSTIGAAASASCGSGFANCVISVILRASATADGAIKFRATDANNYWIADLQTVNAFILAKNEGGSFAGMATIPFTVTAGVDYLLEVTLSGSSISATVNGGSLISASSSFNSTATRHGIWQSASAVAATFNDFKIMA